MEKHVNVGSDHAFVVLGVHVRVLTLIKGCHSNASFACTSMMFTLVIFFNVHVKTALYSHQPFSLTSGHSLIFKEFIAYMRLELWDNLHHPNAR